MDRKQEKFKILKFGGTSLGTVERIKHVANLICNNELNLVVLSAMSGTTNSLAEIASLLFNGDIDGAQRDIECLKSKYIEVADKLYLSAKSIEEAKKFILCSFSSLQTIAQSPISSKQEKIILAQGDGVAAKMRLPLGGARAFEAAGKQGCDCVAWSRKRRAGFISR